MLAPMVMLPNAEALVDGATACISLDGKNVVRVVAPPSLPPSLVRRAIQYGWSLGIAGESHLNGFHEFTLRGSPWVATDQFQPGHHTLLLLSIVRTLAQGGWRLAGSINTSKRLSAVDSLFFVRAEPRPRPVLFTVHMPSLDSVSLSGERATGREADIQAALRCAVARGWPGVVLRERFLGGFFTLTLDGSPWSGIVSCDAAVRALMLHMVRAFAEIGFGLAGVCSVWAEVGASEDGRMRLPVPDAWLFELDGSDSTASVDSLPPALIPCGTPAGCGAMAALTALGNSLLEIVAPPEIGKLVVDAISSNWDRGICSVESGRAIPADRARPTFVEPHPHSSPHDGAVTLVRLNGSPWCGSSEDAVKSRRLLLALLARLRRGGWRLYAAPDACLGNFATHPWLFERCKPMPAIDMCAVALADRRKLRLIHSADASCKEAASAAADAISAAVAMVPGTSHRAAQYCGAAEWTFGGVIWADEGKDTVWSHALIANIIGAMQRAGFELLTACRMSNKELQRDTLVFTRTFGPACGF
ncbi:hypothetical protein HK105_205594 [Polyrhizophydium stewartii]|uniref:Uncharacterized protein n=1 Tax=Polyrhizophydium stewartii TaxID=2732419 RepID=A0ABR4N5P9_9FUNG|nr:hypothetical protein HK105_007041 [Polyrhizophydium stewartii]